MVTDEATSPKVEVSQSVHSCHVESRNKCLKREIHFSLRCNFQMNVINAMALKEQNVINKVMVKNMNFLLERSDDT